MAAGLLPAASYILEWLRSPSRASIASCDPGRSWMVVLVSRADLLR
jgi:hypothetical protein